MERDFRKALDETIRLLIEVGGLSRPEAIKVALEQHTRERIKREILGE